MVKLDIQHIASSIMVYGENGLMMIIFPLLEELSQAQLLSDPKSNLV
jgi:hypothetical protein